MIIYFTKAFPHSIMSVHEAKAHVYFGLRRIRDAVLRCPDANLRCPVDSISCLRISRLMLATSFRVGTF
jgi:hypothetical protein